MLLNASSQNGTIECDMTRAELGGLILSEWNLPGHIVSAVSSYEAPAMGSKGRPCLAAFTHLSCGISRLLGITTSLEPGEFNLCSKAVKEAISDDGIVGVLPGVLKELRSNGLLEYLSIDMRKT